MPFVLLLVGAILVVSALQNTQGDLAGALEQDVPGYLVWALALAGVGALGWVPGMRTVSRGLLALILVVLVLRNYQQMIAGFTSIASGSSAPATASASPAEAYVANPSAPKITEASISGTSAGAGVALAQHTASPFGAYDPAAFLSAFQAGVGGFGGVA